MFDRHHIIHTRSDWTSNPTAKRLREIPELVPRIDRELHNEIHRQSPAVPLLGYHALVRTARDFEPAPTTWETVENLMSAVEATTRHPRAKELERRLGELVVHTLDIQRLIFRGEGI